MKQYADMALIWAFHSSLANLVILPFLIKHFEDTTLILVSLTTTALAMVMFTMGKGYIYALLVGCLTAFYWPIEKISNSLLSKMVRENEVGTTSSYSSLCSSSVCSSYCQPQVGTAFSLLAVTSKCIDFVAKPSYGFLYRATVDVFPATFLLVTTGFFAVIAVLIGYLHLAIVKRKMELKDEC